MTRTIVDVHVLQTVPPSNLNRDDTGSPKSAVYGGVRRARVSSQAWKRATRTAFADHYDPADLGERTRRVVELVAEEITALDPSSEEQAPALAAAVLEAAAGIKLAAPKSRKDGEAELAQSGYLLFLSRHQVKNLARIAADAAATHDPAQTVKARAKDAKAAADADHSVDLALFGRMVADQADLNVDAAAQVAHAISVHSVDTEFDYFTAVDDHNPEEESGAGMIGTIEFNSSTLYRYATVDVDALNETLGSTEATARAVQAFVRSWVRSMPTGKQNTFANRTLPEAVVVLVRDRQPVNLVQAFEEPVVTSAVSSRIGQSCQRLADEAKAVEEAYGERPVASWVTRLGKDTAALDGIAEAAPLDDVVDALGAVVTERLSEKAPVTADV